jgi:hypothetical protein
MPSRHEFPDRAERAYAAVLPELEAQPDTALESVDVDVTKAVTLVLGALPDILALAPQIAEELPFFDIRIVKGLEARALALAHAHHLAAEQGNTVPRNRAWALLKRSYDQTRAAIRLIRHQEQDTDTIAPPITG